MTASRLAFLFLSLCVFTLAACSSGKRAPVIGVVQIVEDATLDEARTGFTDALKAAGFENGKALPATDAVKKAFPNIDLEKPLTLTYRNAQGDAATLNQILDSFIGDRVLLIAANTTVPTVAAVQKTEKLTPPIPVCMMVAPRPDLAGLTKPDGSNPSNLTGTYETLAYIDTSIALIKQVFPAAKRVGSIYNTSEPNSVNSMNRLKAMCGTLGLELIAQAVTNSNETQPAMQALMSKDVEVFFALPDNIIFASFETVYSEASKKKVPIVTSEAGLVKRGAFIAYGADLYEWGKQAGKSAVKILNGESLPAPDEVLTRKRVYNAATASALGLTPPVGFEALK